MLNFKALFQLERFITPSIIKVFYWLNLVIIALLGLSGVVSSITMMFMLDPGVLGLGLLIATFAAVAILFIVVRIGMEFILVVFRINEHLGAIRKRAEM